MRHESCVVILSSKVKVYSMRSWTRTGLLAVIATLAGAASAEAAAIPLATLFRDFNVIVNQTFVATNDVEGPVLVGGTLGSATPIGPSNLMLSTGLLNLAGYGFITDTGRRARRGQCIRQCGRLGLLGGRRQQSHGRPELGRADRRQQPDIAVQGRLNLPKPRCGLGAAREQLPLQFRDRYLGPGDRVLGHAYREAGQ